MRIGLGHFLFKIKIAETDRYNCDEGLINTKVYPNIVPMVCYSAYEIVGTIIGH